MNNDDDFTSLGTSKEYNSDPEIDSLTEEIPKLPIECGIPICTSISHTERKHQFEEPDQDEAAALPLDKTLSMTNRYDPDPLDSAFAGPSTSTCEPEETSEQKFEPQIFPADLPQFQSSSIYRNYMENYQTMQASFSNNSSLNSTTTYQQMQISAANETLQNQMQAAVVQAQQSNLNDQLQKSIFSQQTIHPQYRILVSDNTSPEIISPPSSVTITADIHATQTGIPDININDLDRANIFTTLSSNLEQKEREEESQDSTPTSAVLNLNRLLKTDGLQDPSEPTEPESANISTDDEDELAAKLLMQKQASKAGTGETLCTF